MKREYVEKIYAAWLAKNIGIRYGAAIEGWTYEKIENMFGELTDYPADYKTFAADDDANGPLFFIRALEDCADMHNLKAQDVAEALLNYAPFEHGFFWWGGYGISTEHTAYLNLRNGINAPESGSIEQNGSTVAEQIGGQIFVDTWGLVNPGNPDRAAAMAEKAASVTHGGNGIYGGMFIAACIAEAFVESDMTKIIEKGLSYIPADCEYTRVMRAVMDYHSKNPDNWRDCFFYVKENFGYQCYPGNCHIMPNSAVMVLGLLYGEGDFDKTLSITNMCGWDTDCNVGNIATIMGVLVGTEGIPKRWKDPINDILISSSVIGSLNITDLPYGATYFAKLACALNGEEMPAPYNAACKTAIDSCHFEYPGSTHAMKMRVVLEQKNRVGNQELQYNLFNSGEQAHSGERSLKFNASPIEPGAKLFLYKDTHLSPSDFSDSRYDPCFSPTVYPGMNVHASVYIPAYGDGGNFLSQIKVRLGVHDKHSDSMIESDSITVETDKWYELDWQIPALEGVLLDQMGVTFSVNAEHKAYHLTVAGFVDDLYADGSPDYTIDFAKEHVEFWSPVHLEISQFTKLKGLFYLENNDLHLSCGDFGEAYTGRYDFTDYSAEYDLTPYTGECHMVNIRVGGAERSYAAGLLPSGAFAILKKQGDYKVVAEIKVDWKLKERCKIAITAKGNVITATLNGGETLSFTDNDSPHLQGSIGISVKNGSHTAYHGIKVTPCK